MTKLVTALGLLLLLPLPLTSGAAPAPATVEGAGSPTLVSFLCGPWESPAVAHVTLVRTDTPFYEWDVAVEVAGALCPVSFVARCWGGGTLDAGIVLYNCSDGGEGVVGPIQACAEPGQEASWGSGLFRYANALGHVEGELSYLLTGDAVGEANPCD